MRRLCYMSPNKCAMLLHKFAMLVEKACATRTYHFLKFILGITYIEKLRLAKGYVYIFETIKAVYTTWSKFSFLIFQRTRCSKSRPNLNGKKTFIKVQIKVSSQSNNRFFHTRKLPTISY